jgi:hypothetical protein
MSLLLKFQLSRAIAIVGLIAPDKLTDWRRARS